MTTLLQSQGPTVHTTDQYTLHQNIVDNLDTLLTTAQPVLHHIARLQGVGEESVDDVVQETLVTAWKSLHNLREPEKFESWLNGICRNISHRYIQQNQRNCKQAISLQTLLNDSNEETFPLEIADTSLIDPVEDLYRQDMERLLDQAFSHLSQESRQLLELCYLAEIPQREAALKLGLTIGALEQRLHRARKQLHQLLHSTLREEAVQSGLILDADTSRGWQETRQWCWLCGERRLRATFETQQNGHVDLRTRCPYCSQRYDIDMTYTGGLISVAGLKSFRPAFKRAMQHFSQIYGKAIHTGRCALCQSTTSIKLIDSNEAPFSVPSGRFWLSISCSNCGNYTIDSSSCALTHPIVQQFILESPRIMLMPCEIIDYENKPTIRQIAIDVRNKRQLTAFTDTRTFELCTIFFE